MRGFFVTGGGGSGGSGDVSGPASSTDNAIPRYDGTGGKTLQESGVTIPDGASCVITTAGLALLDDAAASNQRTTLGLGTAATAASSAFATAAQGATADTAIQPGDDAALLGSGAAADGLVLTADGVGGTAFEAISGLGLGDVTGPAGSTDNTAARFDGVTGKVIQGSPLVIGDTGDLSGIGDITLSGTVDGRDVAADGTKLDGIESAADVTDATNVDAAGAVMNSDASTASMSFVIDEDNMASDSATKVPTQQSVKSYADTKATTATKIDDFAAPDDNTDLNASSTAHGLCPKLSNTTYTVLRGDGAFAAIPEVFMIPCSDETTALTTGVKFTFYMPFAMTVTDVYAQVVTAPTGAALIVDIHEAGTTIMATNKITIDVSEFESKEAGTQPTVSDTALAARAKMTIEVDQIGSTVAGAGLKVFIVGTRSA